MDGGSGPAAQPPPAQDPGRQELLAWCRELEARLEELGRRNAELLAENDRLARRSTELAAIVRAIEEASVLGRLRAAGAPVRAPVRAPAAATHEALPTEAHPPPPPPDGAEESG